MGDEIDIPIDAMYRAGKLDIPAESEWVSRVAGHLHDVLHAFDTQSALAGDPPLMTSMLGIGGEVYETLRTTLISLDNCATSVIATADDFVAHDERARADFAHLNEALVTMPTPHHSVPEPLGDLTAPGGAAPGQPSRIGRGDFEPHPEVQIRSTPDPVAPQTDHDQRQRGQQHDQDNTPLVPPVVK